MPATVIIYIKYIIDINYKLAKLFIKSKITLGRGTHTKTALDFPTFPLD